MAAPVAPVVDGERAAQDARGLVREIYQTLGRGKTDSLFSLVSESLIVFGPRRGDAMSSRSDALVALGQIVDARARKPLALRSRGLAVTASPGGLSAWASDVVTIDGQPVALTAVLANTDEIWAVTAAALAVMPNARQVKAEAARDAIVPPGGAAVGKVDARTAAAVERFRKGFAEPQLWAEDLVRGPDGVVIGPLAGQAARGKPAIERLWKARAKAKLRRVASGDVTSSITPDGALIWLSVPATRVADDEDTIPLRIFAIYERAGASWRLAVLHEAIAIDEPGAGAAFKKILPPEPPPEPAIEPAPVKPEPVADKPSPAAKHKVRSKPRTQKKPRKAKAP